jgi:rhamnosyl/mannosyltransferase
MNIYNNIRPLHIGKFVTPPYGGVEAHVDTLLRSLLPDIRGKLVAGESPMLDAVSYSELPYRVLTAKSFGKFASATMSPGVVIVARKEFKSGRCNLLHIHSPNPWGDVVALTTSRDVPVVMSWHSDIVRQRKLMKIYRHIQRRVLDRVDKIIVFTPKHYSSSEQLHQINVESKIVHVPMGIDFDLLDKKNADQALTSKIDDFSQGRPVLLTVGRHVYYKGYSYLISALSKIKSDAVLVMIGSGVLSDSLKAQAVELGLNKRILFLGEVDSPKLVSAFHRCDLFCLPSIEPSEAFGIASAEAMACGKPTVVCELNNGVNYLNKNGETGITVMPRNVEALANAIDVLIFDDALRSCMGLAASKWVRNEFSSNAMKNGTIGVYQSLI